MKLLKVTIIGLLTLAFYGMGRSQNPILPSSNIVQQALHFADGHSLALQGRAKIAWQERCVFSGDIGSIYVDTLTGQVTAAFYKLSMSGEQITQEEAEKRAKSWLVERGIILSEWILEERRVYDRGSVGKEYIFRWVKRSPEGIYLPCILSESSGRRGRDNSLFLAGGTGNRNSVKTTCQGRKGYRDSNASGKTCTREGKGDEKAFASLV